MSDSLEWRYTNSGPYDNHSGRLFKFDDGYVGSLGVVDEHGKLWYRLSCSYWFGDWIEEQDKILWRAHGERHRAIYIVREELMMLIQLRWL